MEQSLLEFQKRKEGKKIGFVVAEETETFLSIQDQEENFKHTYSYLGAETQRFRKLEPTLSTSFITRLWDKQKGIDDFTLEFQFFGCWLALSAEMSGIENGSEPYVQMNFSLGKEEWFPRSNLHVKHRKELQRIYHHFKEIIKEFPEYRLPFVTQHIGFDELDLRDWFE